MKNPLSLAELQDIAGAGKTTVVGLINTKSQGFKALQPDLSAMNDAAAAALLYENPKMMVRPLLTDGKQLVTGFKEADYTKFFA